ncbi:hypothetical protein M5X11_24850 [Paenibacillus alginolyticus]|uniref:Uncharacterized protein n=1 Tax=Paenibacillus alginolyticus TaxID=59839 RepID=A0ABT4GMM4_9BACL|nr:hypothetical protein [Paenibacillus alginolyticus]MCY9668113.1 hypothetical protein [Paenibacillus alginolyticus]MCY9697471.1 hypothetical protein [Paenibacillus alginolyticus]MEC0148294.1 hypothetical protein [Paenibacillus alginolyticus]
MIVAGIFVIAIVPFIAAGSPVLAVWKYTGGWTFSALSMICFFYLEHFPLYWWKAYGEPLIPTLIMIVIIEAGRFTGAWYIVFIYVGLLCLMISTFSIEIKPMAVRGFRIRYGRRP